ncbi:hypothetical protein BGX23_002632 [Mortierella sp. AD031]|nr:hypothetical protein BGX23_002632 [Mortierella sp. AD031]KAG0206758.1 hypothetical protein BGX33_007226 [Mortierella sp. NVP41]
MEHYMSDILAPPAAAAMPEAVGTSYHDSHKISTTDLTEKLHEIKHHHNVLSAQSNSWGDLTATGVYSSYSSSTISSTYTTSSSLPSRPRTPKEALLFGLLDRLDQNQADRDLDRIRELEIENEMLRRHHLQRINPDLLDKDHGHTLSQNHGNANLRHR